MPDSASIEVIVDTREQRPWHFAEGAARVIRGTLPTGDYALVDDYAFAIERKSLDDFVQSVVHNYDRFTRELDRMDGWVAKVIIVEANMIDIIRHNYTAPTVKPALILKRISQLTLRGVSVMFAGNPDMAAGLAWRILYQRHKQREDMF